MSKFWILKIIFFLEKWFSPLFEEFRLHLLTHALCKAKSGLRKFLVADPPPEVVVGVIPLQTGPSLRIRARSTLALSSGKRLSGMSRLVFRKRSGDRFPRASPRGGESQFEIERDLLFRFLGMYRFALRI